jgi:hypothetical protein
MLAQRTANLSVPAIVPELGMSVPPKSPMVGFRCQALVSLGLLAAPIKDKANGFPTQAVLDPKGGVRDFRVLVRIGDDFFVALANLFKRESSVFHNLVLRPIRSCIIAPQCRWVTAHQQSRVRPTGKRRSHPEVRSG